MKRLHSIHRLYNVFIIFIIFAVPANADTVLQKLTGSPAFEGDVCVAQDEDRTLIVECNYHRTKGLTIWSVSRGSDEVVKYVDGVKLESPSRVPQNDNGYPTPQKIHGLFLAKGRIFICAWDTLWVLENHDGHWTPHFIDITYHGEIVSDSVYDVVPFGNRTLIATYAGLYQWDDQAAAPKPVPGAMDAVITCIKIIGHRAYIGGSNGYTLNEGDLQAKPIENLSGLQPIFFASVGSRVFIGGANDDTELPSKVAVLDQDQPLNWVELTPPLRIASHFPPFWITDITDIGKSRALIATRRGIWAMDDSLAPPRLYMNCGNQNTFGLPRIQCAGATILALVQVGGSTQIWDISDENNFRLVTSPVSHDSAKFLGFEDKRFLALYSSGVYQILTTLSGN